MGVGGFVANLGGFGGVVRADPGILGDFRDCSKALGGQGAMGWRGSPKKRSMGLREAPGAASEKRRSKT